MKSAAGLLLDHLLFLMQRPVPCSPRSKAYVMLMDVGVPDNYKGHEYVLQAIILQHVSPERGLKNDIYHEITLRYRLNSEEQVDQAIRQVLKVAWQQGDRHMWECYFSRGGRVLLKRPTNSEFISRFAYILELWQESRREEDRHARQR